MGVNALGLTLEVQKYLRSGKTVEDLEKEFGIYSYEHPELPLVGFKYGLITSDKQKFHPIVRECRGVVLERDSWDIIAYPFKRFFNLGEDRETEASFNWDNFTCQEKKDGSLIILYYYDGDWRVNTSGSFGQGICYDSGVTWEELFWKTSNIDRQYLHKEFTYVFELWTKYNKIVRSYDKPHVTLIGMRNANCYRKSELPYHSIVIYADDLNVKYSANYQLSTIDDVVNFLKDLSFEDPTFEGVVLCDDDFRRIKVKSDSYKQLHQLKGNGQFIYRNIVPQLLKGNFSQLSKDFPEWLEELEECSQEIDRIKLQTDNLWWEFGELKERKKFTKMIKQHATLPAILFWMYDGKYTTVDEAFLKNEDLLIKYFEGKK